ncbi:MAG: 50S ribosomal protein L21 [Phycisphaerales bacterium]|nr:50S ribosomal protein L21 [Planctomycetota bacterium]
MYAIIEEFGGQRKVTQGEEILVDLTEQGNAKVGSSITFDKVLVVGKEGGDAKIGQPYVSGASVKAEVVDPKVAGEKIYIHHFREAKTWRKKTGHRQKYTKIKITAING